MAPFKAQLLPYLHMYAQAVRENGLTPPAPELLDAAGHTYGLLLYKYNADIGPEVAALFITLALFVPPALEWYQREEAKAAKEREFVDPFPSVEAKAA